ncbi:CBS domain-containing protein [Deinococcus sp. LM3]|uniref:CBS domain-containing protein n=1 Tax=Deinococcus sp. LM3 TaxID=1938608 RepID=UPI00117D52C2|nr:CBS domain-containing protein [Deinococcus sp. LM3]
MKSLVAEAIALEEEEASYFLRVLRDARYAALADAENFRSVCFALEELGMRLRGENLRSLRKYKTILQDIVPTKLKNEYSEIFDLVVSARNEAAHRGIFARNLASKSIRLSIIVEAGLQSMTTKVKHIMSQNVIFAEKFYSLAKVREIMLENSFSYVPISLEDKYYLIPDFLIAQLWHDKKSTDKLKYNTKIDDILDKKDLLKPIELLSNAKKSAALNPLLQAPALVFNGTHAERVVVGILSPFDLL